MKWYMWWPFGVLLGGFILFMHLVIVGEAYDMSPSPTSSWKIINPRDMLARGIYVSQSGGNCVYVYPGYNVHVVPVGPGGC